MFCQLLRSWPRTILLCTLLLASVPAVAQSDIQRDVSRLQWRFDSLLKAKTPQAVDPIQQNIEAERAAIRSEFEKEFQKTIKDLEQNRTEPADLVQALDRQRTIVDAISQRIDEAKADLALLENEESYYKDIQKSGTGSLPSDQILLTKSYPELLAKKAIMEERLAVLHAFQKTQNDRLNTLKQEALTAIAQLPDVADIDTIMYRLYMIDKVRKGKEAVERGETISVEDLKREIESW